MLIFNAKLVLLDRIVPGAVVIRNGKIKTILPSGVPLPDDANAFDANGWYLAPGFIDLHSHGAGGADFMDDEDDSFETVLRLQIQHGVTGSVPTALSAPTAALSRMITRYHVAKRENAPDLPELLGLHLEGPYFHPDMCGAQDASCIRAPDAEEYSRLFEEANGEIRLWSSAPELPNAAVFGDWLRAHGITAAIGHSTATASQVQNSMLHGYSHVTHLYSACSTITRTEGHRIPGIVECALLYDGLTVELIADGQHLPPELIRLVYQVRGAHKICLITDSMRAAGMGEGFSILGAKRGGQVVTVRDGVARMPDGTSFAGSVATADQLVRTACSCGIPLWDAIRMTSLTPASVLGCAERKGSIEPGKDADLILFDEHITIKQVIRHGICIGEAYPRFGDDGDDTSACNQRDACDDHRRGACTENGVAASR